MTNDDGTILLEVMLHLFWPNKSSTVESSGAWTWFGRIACQGPQVTVTCELHCSLQACPRRSPPLPWLDAVSPQPTFYSFPAVAVTETPGCCPPFLRWFPPNVERELGMLIRLCLPHPRPFSPQHRPIRIRERPNDRQRLGSGRAAEVHVVLPDNSIRIVQVLRSSRPFVVSVYTWPPTFALIPLKPNSL